VKSLDQKGKSQFIF